MNPMPRSAHFDYHVVITSIQNQTQPVKTLVNKTESTNGCVLIVCDLKSPLEYGNDKVDYLTVEKQKKLNYELLQDLPYNHYGRKNLGYLRAIEQKAAVIYETDDDNSPNLNWNLRSKTINEAVKVSQDIASDNKWVNVYRFFTDESIWPRGLPLEEIANSGREFKKESVFQIEAPIQQGLVNGSPDVDAVWRLTQDRPFEFTGEKSICIEPGLWCPFNTQSTWWWAEAYPLLYIPSNCNFRMCDIWKSFIAQWCLWELGHGIVFHPPEVDQDRNEHSLVKDFEDEISGYLGNQKLIACLENVSMRGGQENVLGNLIRCYEQLISNGFFPSDEMALVKAWANDIEKLTG